MRARTAQDRTIDFSDTAGKCRMSVDRARKIFDAGKVRKIRVVGIGLRIVCKLRFQGFSCTSTLIFPLELMPMKLLLIFSSATN